MASIKIYEGSVSRRLTARMRPSRKSKKDFLCKALEYSSEREELRDKPVHLQN
jgi:hypothetical protein